MMNTMTNSTAPQPSSTGQEVRRSQYNLSQYSFSQYSFMDTPLGALLLVGRGGVLTGLFVSEHAHAPRPGPDWARDDSCFDVARAQLDEYFQGNRRTFQLRLQPAGTAFQLATWAALQQIPFGETISYRELAASIGRPTASRAVGAANGRNPVSIIIPCHRVIGANGQLTGYGWGTERKAWLLDHEAHGTTSPATLRL